MSGPADATLLAFAGKDANAPDEFAFVAVRDIANGTQIYFTNYDRDNATGAFVTTGVEGTLLFTATALIPAGTVVQVIETEPDVYSVIGSGTAVHVSGEWAAVSADPHYAFFASNPALPLTSGTQVHACMDTDPDTAVGGSKDPRIGVNPSPGAFVLDFVDEQPVGADLNADRTMAVLSDLAVPGSFTTTTGPTNLGLDLTEFARIATGEVFFDGFEQ